MTALASILARIEASRAWEVEPWEAGADYKPHLAERTARRVNKKAREAAPLFAHAGMVEQVTPEQIKAKYDRNHAAYARHIVEAVNRQAAEAIVLLAEVSNYLSDDQLAECEAYRVRVYPRSIVYDLDYWNKVLQERDHA